MIALDLRDVHAGYGQGEVLRGIDLSVEEGEFVGIVGPNGAGKSTLLRTIMSQVRVKQGSVSFKGRPITGTRTFRVVRSGLCLVPEGRAVFPEMTVFENLQMGGFVTRHDRGVLNDRLGQVRELFPRLKERSAQDAGTLSGGEQQMLAIGRAMMAAPHTLLLDEPSLGLSPTMTREVFSALVQIHRSGTTVVLVEQNARMALAVSERACVIQQGRVVNEGASSDLLNDVSVQAAYLGVTDVAPDA